MAWLSNNASIQIFNENFKPSQYILHKLSYLPHFYRELTLFWENVSHTEPDNVSEILKPSLWNNKYICKSNSSLYYPSLSAKGINKIGDIFSDSGTLLQWKDAIDKFDLQPRDIMQWLSLCISIPAIWKSKLNKRTISWPTAQGDCTQLHHLAVKSVYKKQLKSLIKTPTSQIFLKSSSILVGLINWAITYMIPQKVTIESSLRVFQYQLPNNAIF